MGLLKALRDQFGLLAAVCGSIPAGMVGHTEAPRTSIPKLRTKVELSQSVDEAFRKDFESLGRDMEKAIADFRETHERKV